jgi:peptidylprolyl isomerase
MFMITFSSIGLLLVCATALQTSHCSRRDAFALTNVVITNFVLIPASPSIAASESLDFSTSKSGIQWADAKLGSGQTLTRGSSTSIDYALSTTGARYGSKIYSNSNSGAPYQFVIGDGSTIKGIEEAIVGNDDIPPMRPGGIRRVILPPNLAYESLANISEGCGANVGPVPPPTEAFEEFQRFKNIYCNPNRAYQPDVVMDIKLYGRRTME